MITECLLEFLPRDLIYFIRSYLVIDLRDIMVYNLVPIIRCFLGLASETFSVYVESPFYQKTARLKRNYCTKEFKVRCLTLIYASVIMIYPVRLLTPKFINTIKNKLIEVQYKITFAYDAYEFFKLENENNPISLEAPYDGQNIIIKLIRLRHQNASILLMLRELLLAHKNYWFETTLLFEMFFASDNYASAVLQETDLFYQISPKYYTKSKHSRYDYLDIAGNHNIIKDKIIRRSIRKYFLRKLLDHKSLIKRSEKQGITRTTQQRVKKSLQNLQTYYLQYL